uniref:Uncharacterized protein n=1 Tax=Oryza glumipatula TaxID=40148 RepID=A0A0D9ZJJ6_9ORYZ
MRGGGMDPYALPCTRGCKACMSGAWLGRPPWQPNNRTLHPEAYHEGLSAGRVETNDSSDKPEPDESGEDREGNLVGESLMAKAMAQTHRLRQTKKAAQPEQSSFELGAPNHHKGTMLTLGLRSMASRHLEYGVHQARDACHEGLRPDLPKPVHKRGIKPEASSSTGTKPYGEGVWQRPKDHVYASQQRGPYGQRANGEGHAAKHEGFAQAGAEAKKEDKRAARHIGAPPAITRPT